MERDTRKMHCFSIFGPGIDSKHTCMYVLGVSRFVSPTPKMRLHGDTQRFGHSHGNEARQGLGGIKFRHLGPPGCWNLETVWLDAEETAALRNAPKNVYLKTKQVARVKKLEGAQTELDTCMLLLEAR